MTFAPIENLTLKLDVRYVGKRTDVYYDSKRGPFGALGAIPIDEYTLVDVSQRLALSDSFSVNARVENLFNVKYSEINGFSTRGRGFYLSVRYALDSAF
jgi:vitamin B12 transporter